MNELIDRWIECAQQEGKAVKEEKQYDYGCEPFPSQTTQPPHPQKFLCSGYKLAFGSLVIVKTLTLSLCIPRETIVSSNKRRVAFIHPFILYYLCWFCNLSSQKRRQLALPSFHSFFSFPNYPKSPVSSMTIIQNHPNKTKRYKKKQILIATGRVQK